MKDSPTKLLYNIVKDIFRSKNFYGKLMVYSYLDKKKYRKYFRIILMTIG